jgi:hypothetical protein
MSSPFEARRLGGTLRFLAELESVAAEFVASGVLDDELTSRRRQRGDSYGFEEAVTEELQVKAL